MTEQPDEHEDNPERENERSSAEQSVDDHPRTSGETSVDDAIGTTDEPT